MTPQDLGLPQASWRPGQWDFVMGIASDPHPYQMLVAPTGFGKSLTYMAIAQLTGDVMVVLTATKSLQDQLVDEFEAALDMVDIRGQSNYPCNAPGHPLTISLAPFFRRGQQYTVRQGPCRFGLPCPLKDSGCAYYDRIREGQRAQIVVTNYDFWMRSKQKFPKPGLLVMDEAHQAPQELSDFMSFRLTAAQKKMFRGSFPQSEEVADWIDWAEWAARHLDAATDPNRGRPSEELLQLKADVGRMEEMLTEGSWVIENTERGDVHFDCIDSRRFGGKYLWGGASKVLMVSATVNAMTAEAIGIASASLKTWEAKSSFPVERRPVYIVQGAVRLNFRSSEGEKRMWVNLIDRIIDQRKDRKGILHTTSFDRARYFMEHTRHKRLAYLNDSRSTIATVDRFKKSRTGAILVSPSVTTGWDFPGDQCEYQIIGKIPFPDLRTKAAKVVNKANKEWSGYSAAQTIVQSSGRGSRSITDQCETFVVDGNFDWWWGSNRRYIPKWWQEAVQWITPGTLPVPPPPLLPASGW